MEGNPLHRSNAGGLNNFHQSMILDLYDPQRLRSSTIEGTSKGLDEVKAFIRTKGILDKTSGKKWLSLQRPFLLLNLIVYELNLKLTLLDLNGLLTNQSVMILNVQQ
jgi:hypothetical protein